jgi:hypothetical protein
VDKFNCHRALTNCGSDAIHRTGSDVPGGKNAGTTGFQKKRFAFQFPQPLEVLMASQIAPGFNETTLVFNDIQLDPVRKGLGTNEDVKGRSLYALLLTGLDIF